MKKETAIILFYVLYFSWLFIVTFLAPDTKLLAYFTSAIAVFYFVLLRERWDFFWFLLGASFMVLTASTSFNRGEFKFNFGVVTQLPVWLYLAWGTTFVALRKFFLIVTR